MNFIGIQSLQSTRLEDKGVSPVIGNDLSPEKTGAVISLLKGLAFRAAVRTAENAIEWQAIQKEHWRDTERVCVAPAGKP